MAWQDSLATHIWIFSVGRGNAAFIRTGLNQGFILDMNASEFDPAQFIKKKLVKKVSAYNNSSIAQAVLSHPHADHIAQCRTSTTTFRMSSNDASRPGAPVSPFGPRSPCGPRSWALRTRYVRNSIRAGIALWSLRASFAAWTWRAGKIGDAVDTISSRKSSRTGVSFFPAFSARPLVARMHGLQSRKPCVDRFERLMQCVQ